METGEKVVVFCGECGKNLGEFEVFKGGVSVPLCEDCLDNERARLAELEELMLLRLYPRYYGKS